MADERLLSWFSLLRVRSKGAVITFKEPRNTLYFLLPLPSNFNLLLIRSCFHHLKCSFSTQPYEHLSISCLGGGASLCIVGCSAASLVSAHWMPIAYTLSPAATTKNVSRHCQEFLRGQNRSLLKTTGLKE